MKAVWMLLLCLLSVPQLAEAKRYRGNGIYVVDAVARDFPKIRFAVDPAIARALYGKDLSLQVAEGASPQNALKEVLQGKGYALLAVRDSGIYLVCDQSSAAYQEACGLLSKDMARAQEAFQQIRNANPQNQRAKVMDKILEGVADKYRAADEAKAAYETAKEPGMSQEAFEAFMAFVKVSDELMGDILPKCKQAASMQLAADVAPLMERAKSDLEYVLKEVGDLPMEAQEQLKEPLELANRQKALSYMEAQLSMARTSREQSDYQTREALNLIQNRKPAEAYAHLLQAYDLSDHNLVCRSWLGFLQLRMRITFARKLENLQAQPYVTPDREGLGKALTGLVDTLEKEDDGIMASYLRIMLAQDSRLQDVAAASDIKSLDTLVRTRRDPVHEGRIEGLATFGGQNTGGHMLPVSITFDTREDFTRPIDLELNDVAQQFDTYMRISMMQMLQWINSLCESQLGLYKVTIHFKDLMHGKGGDSLGAAMGCCAFSAIFEQPLRQVVTLTGSIRADGQIGPVGAISAKIEAAIRAGKKTVVIPSDNEVDLHLIGDSIVRRIRIIIGAEMNDYLFHAAMGVPDKRYAWRLNEGFYRTAWLYENLGLLEDALGLYREVLKETPNDYSTRKAIEQIEPRVAQARRPDWVEDWNGSVEGLQRGDLLVCSDASGSEMDKRLKSFAHQLAVVASQFLADQTLRFEGGYLLDLALFVDAEEALALELAGRRSRGLAVEATVEKGVDKISLEALCLEMAEQYEPSSDSLMQKLLRLYSLLPADVLRSESGPAVAAVARIEKSTGDKQAFAPLFSEIQKEYAAWTGQGEVAVVLNAKKVDYDLLLKRKEAAVSAQTGADPEQGGGGLFKDFL